MGDPRFSGLYGIAGPAAGTTPAARRAETFALAQAFLQAGVRVLQLRDKHSDGRSLVGTARELQAMCRAAGALFVVNDRLDVALAAGADGVHVGQDDLAPADVRRVVSACGRGEFVIGLSTHDADQVRDAVRLGVDYLGFGPVFGTRTKADALAPRGVARLSEAVSLAGNVPLVAIGGISRSNLSEVVATGAPMAAVISDVQQAPDPAIRATELQQVFRTARPAFAR